VNQPEQPRPLLATIPSGTFLSAVLGVLLSGDRAEEFLGDLIEEAHLRRRRDPSTVAAWLWSQTLRSVPALVGMRIRRFVTRGQPMSGDVLVGFRSGQRTWPLSLVVSVSAHALLLAATSVWFLTRVEEVQPHRSQVSVALFAPQPAPALFHPVETTGEPPRVRQVRPMRRSRIQPSVAVTMAALDTVTTTPREDELPEATTPTPLPVAPIAVPQPAPLVRLPPQVAEKRCVSCPSPQLPEAYARLGLAQEVRVKTCVGMDGNVTSVDVVNGFDSTIDARIVDTLRSWRLTPYLLDGHPVPFCYRTQFVFAPH
jgi:outer membrane biosynthesis protein TonB